MAEKHALADVSPGSVLNELLLKVAAQIHEEITSTDIAALGQASTVQDALASSGDTYSPLMDALASNYGVTRNEGRKVRGSIKVTVAGRRTYFIDKGFKFVQPNLGFSYAVPEAVEAVFLTPGDLLRTGQVQLKAEGAGYYFVVVVEASGVGEEVVGGDKNNTQVTNRTRFQLDPTLTLNGFVGAEAYGNFTSGLNRETDRDLIFRFRDGLSYKGLSSRRALTSVFKAALGTFRTLSVTGAHDAELTRAKNNLFGISHFGMADVHVRNGDSIETQVVEVRATKTDATTWHMDLGADVVPGFYRIVSVLPAGQTEVGSLQILKQAYGYSQATENANHLSTAAEARFTKYQTCALDFTHTDEVVPITGTKLFTVMVAHMPFLRDAQDLVNSDDNRLLSADYLVRAAVPCLVSVNLRLERKFPSEELPVEEIRREIFDYINSIPFGEPLIVSRLVDICHNYAVKRVDLPVLVQGTIWLPETGKDAILLLSADDKLVIPSLPAAGVSPKTTAFFATYLDDEGEANIAITQA